MKKKNSEIFISITFLFLFFASSGVSIAQVYTVSITTSVMGTDNIGVETIRELKFRQRPTADSLIHLNPVEDPNAGHLVVYGPPHTAFRATFSRVLLLYHRYGHHLVPILYEVSGCSKKNQQVSKPLLLIDREFRLNEEGRFYFWIGGSVHVASIPDGDYTGEFLITIERM